MSRIMLRAFDLKEDAGIIYASWAKGIFFGSAKPIKRPKAQWLAEFSKDIKEKLEKFQVTIACLEDAPSVVMGYVIMDHHILEWVYVKPLMRMQGIAKLLIKNKIIKGFKYVTKAGEAILEAHPELKGEEHVKGESRDYRDKDPGEDQSLS